MFSARIFLLIPVLFLGAVSVTMLLSITPSQALPQAVYFGVGLLVLFAVSRLRASTLLRFAPYVYVLTLLGLFSTLVLGKVSHGAMRWIPLGPLHIQVSEFAKPFVALMLVRFFVSRKQMHQPEI